MHKNVSFECSGSIISSYYSIIITICSVIIIAMVHHGFHLNLFVR